MSDRPENLLLSMTADDRRTPIITRCASKVDLSSAREETTRIALWEFSTKERSPVVTRRQPLTTPYKPTLSLRATASNMLFDRD